MERITAIFSAFSTLCVAVVIGLNFVNSPMDRLRHKLAEDLAEVRPKHKAYRETAEVNSREVRDVLVSRPNLWRELVDPPPPRKRVVKKAPPPDLAKMLTGVSVTRMGFGKGEKMKVLIKTPASPRGNYMAVGDEVMGTTIKMIEKESVVFGLTKAGERFTLRLWRE